MTDIVAETVAGRVRGTRRDGVSAFHGIPYGADTSGSHRFGPPRPAEPWSGVRDATRPSPLAPQVWGRWMAGDGSGISEDCLSLNVWTPELSDRRPVLVWFHGGGYSAGVGCEPSTDATNLVRHRDVVVVSCNHRLGLLGFLHLEDLLGEQYAGSANASLLDLIACLRWVRDNIAAFGGDPDQVTIFGQSGGGGKVGALLAMPEARGLFHGAIIQSGSLFGYRERDVATARAEVILDALGVSATNPERLRTMELDEIVAVQRRFDPFDDGALPGPAALTFTPTLGAAGLTAAPGDAMAAGTAADVPLVLGATRHETRGHLEFMPGIRRERVELSDAELVRRVGHVTEAGFEDVLERYRIMRPDLSNFGLLLEMTGDVFALQHVLLAERRVATQRSPTFQFVVTRESPRVGGMVRAGHEIEVAAVFENPDAGPMIAGHPGATQFAETASALWTDFARDPQDFAEQTGWRRYDLSDRPTMLLDAVCGVVGDPLADVRAAWAGVELPVTRDPWGHLEG